MNSRHLFLSTMAILVGLSVYGFVNRSPEAVEGMIAEAEGRPVWNERSYKQAMAEIEEAMSQSAAALRAGKLVAAADVLYRAYPPFESLSNEHGYQEVAPGVSLRDWFDRAAESFKAEIDRAYPAIVAGLSEGRISREDVRHLESCMPFPFVMEFKQRFRQDQQQIRTARRANCTDWVLVSVVGTYGNFQVYENLVREALQRKWGNPAGLKLVFGGAMDHSERMEAAKVLYVRVDEKRGQYQFEGGQEYRGTGEVPEAVVVTFENQTRRKDAVRTSWDRIEPITVSHEAPEVLTFKFKNDHQTASFEGIEERQRAALEKKLAPALEAIPPFALL
jgi:hypothetical protein